jgi:hypothetical protein
MFTTNPAFFQTFTLPFTPGFLKAKAVCLDSKPAFESLQLEYRALIDYNIDMDFDAVFTSPWQTYSWPQQY